MLDYRIDTFLEVCRFMNFTKAARALNITQPAVSQHIKYLEEMYHTTFFQFQGKKMALTREGRLFLNSAKTFRHDELYLRKKLEEARKEQASLICGATLTIGDFVFPEVMRNFLLRHPETDMAMEIGNTSELLKKLDDGEIDFAVVEGYFEKDAYEYRVWSKEKFILAASPVYQFRHPPGKIRDLFGERLIVREQGSGTREVLEKNLQTQNLPISNFSRRHEISSIHVIKSLAEAGCGITFLYQAAVQKELEKGSLKEIPLEDFQVFHDFNFVWRKDSIFSEEYEEIFHEFQKLGGQMHEEEKNGIDSARTGISQ